MTPRFLFKLSISYSKGHPLQKFLLFIGIAIGVAVVVAVDLANDSIGRSFQLSTQSITGKATHQIIGSAKGLDQSLYPRLRNIYKYSAPVVTGYVRVPEFNNRMMQLLGIDSFVDSDFRGYLGNSKGLADRDLLKSLLIDKGKVLVTRELADQFGISPGNNMILKTGNGDQTVTIAGLLESTNSFTSQALSGVILADISTAQEILQLGDRISHIDLIVEHDIKQTLNTIQSLLPEDARIITLQQNRRAVRQMSQSFELNLQALSLLALLVGMFLIYNTITFSVIQRRSQLGTLRALGMTRQEVFGVILWETVFWGLLGTATGLLLGVALGTGIIKLVSRTISDLYFTLTVNTFHLGVYQLAKAFLMGVLASVISAIFPAWEAANIKPIDALRRSTLERKIASNLMILTLTGSLMLIAGAVLLWIPSRSLVLSFGSLLLIVCGSAMLVPIITQILMRFIPFLFSIISGITGKMAARNITRSLSRTGISIASLMIAVSVIVGVGTMVGSFRTTVVAWLSNTIRADLYISPANDLAEQIDISLKAKLSSMPGVQEVYTIRTHPIKFGEYTNSAIVSLDRDTAQRDWLWRIAPEKDLKEMFQNGWIFVSEPFAWKHGINAIPGTMLELDTDIGKQKFKLAGIFRDFSSEQGIILMSEGTFHRFWNDRSIRGVALFVKNGADVEAVRTAVEEKYGSTYNLRIRSNRGLREAAIEVFDRTFTITIALQILAGLVAFIGVLNTVMSLMLERARELGILRANGMTIFQLWRLVLTESGLIGLMSGLFAIPLGTSLAWILVIIINKRSFGWTLDFVLQPNTYIQAMVIALVAAILAGIYPVITMIRKPVAELLRTE